MDIKPLAEHVYDTLRTKMLEGVYAPEQKLNLSQLSRDLKVSTTPICEAMVRLVKLGLVETIPYCGPKIKR